MGVPSPRNRILELGAGLLLAGAAVFAAADAEATLERAREVYVEEGPEPALPIFQEAITLYRREGDRRGEAIALGLIGNCHKRLGDLERARDLLGQALAMKRSLGDRLEEGKTLSHLGLLEWESAEYAAAIGYFEDAIATGAELGDARLEGSARNNLGLVYDELGDFDRSVPEYRRALELYRGIDFPRGESDTLGNLGGVQLLVGRYREAIGYYEQALAISQRLGSKPSMSQDLGNLALCYTGLGETARGIEAFDRALALARESGLAKEEADWLKGKATLLVESGHHAEGLTLFAQALGRYEASGLPRERIETLLELAAVELELGDVAAAERELRSALAEARRIGHLRGELAAQIALGDIERRRIRFEQARALFAEALRGADSAGDVGLAIDAGIRLAEAERDLGRLAAAGAAAELALGRARATGARLQIGEALFALGEIELGAERYAVALERFREGEPAVAPFGEPDVAWRLAHGQGRALEALGRDAEALEAYRRAVERIESVRGRLRDERLRAGYIEERHRAYVDLVRLLLRLGDEEGAFAAAERLRARAYLDLLSRGPTRAPSRDEERRERELRWRIRALQIDLESEGRSPDGERGSAVAILSRELAAAESEYEDLLVAMRATDVDLDASWSQAVPTTALIRARLPADAALVEYVVGDRELMVFLLARDRLATRVVPFDRRDLEAKVALLRELIVYRSGDAWRVPAASLGELLLGALHGAAGDARYRRLFLVPHGVLHHLPFAVLSVPATGRLLVEDHDLVQLPSAARLAPHLDHLAADGRLLATAPAISRLRFAREEAQAVVAASPHPRRLLVGEEATEAALKREAGRFRVVHVATHSAWNRLNPMLTALELEAGGGDDGHLELHEVLDLELRAELVTLSGCETALGSNFFGAVPLGDDFVGLTRAFLRAGSDAVLASLWQVDDRSTASLMREIYERLPAVGPATALAAAQRLRLADPALAHPYHWAAFVVVRGDQGARP